MKRKKAKGGKKLWKMLGAMAIGYLFWKNQTPRIQQGVLTAGVAPMPEGMMGLYGDAPIGMNYGGVPLEEGQQNALIQAGLQQGILELKACHDPLGDYKGCTFKGAGQILDFAQAASLVQQQRGWE